MPPGSAIVGELRFLGCEHIAMMKIENVEMALGHDPLLPVLLTLYVSFLLLILLPEATTMAVFWDWAQDEEPPH